MSDYTDVYNGLGTLRLRDGAIIKDVRYSLSPTNQARFGSGDAVTLAPPDPSLAWAWHSDPRGCEGMVLRLTTGPGFALGPAAVDLRAGVVRTCVVALVP